MPGRDARGRRAHARPRGARPAGARPRHDPPGTLGYALLRLAPRAAARPRHARAQLRRLARKGHFGTDGLAGEYAARLHGNKTGGSVWAGNDLTQADSNVRSLHPHRPLRPPRFVFVVYGNRRPGEALAAVQRVGRLPWPRRCPGRRGDRVEVRAGPAGRRPGGIDIPVPATARGGRDRREDCTPTRAPDGNLERKRADRPRSR